MESVSVRKKGRYEAHDKVDQYLLLQFCRHVQTDSLELLAEYLGVSEEQYVDTRATQPANVRAQIMKVCKVETCFVVPSIFFQKGFARVFIDPFFYLFTINLSILTFSNLERIFLWRQIKCVIDFPRIDG